MWREVKKLSAAACPNFANNFPQGLSSQQAQHRPPQQLTSLGAQPMLTRKPEEARVCQQIQHQRQHQQQQQQECLAITFYLLPSLASA